MKKKLLSKKGPLSEIQNIDADYHLLQEEHTALTTEVLQALSYTLDEITGANLPPLWERFYYGRNGFEEI